jgi:hypothetical protein
VAECFFKTEEQEDRIILLPTERELVGKKERYHVFSPLFLLFIPVVGGLFACRIIGYPECLLFSEEWFFTSELNSSPFRIFEHCFHACFRR